MEASVNTISNKKYLYLNSDSDVIKNSKNPIFNAITFELSSPITIIQSNIQLLKRFCNHPDKLLSDETFSFNEESIENIIGFIEKINFLCTSDQSSIKLNPGWFSLRSLINQVYAEIKLLNLDVSRIKLNYPDQNCRIFTDKYLCNRILVNLLSNALKFSCKEVVLFITSSDDELSIVVRDSGIGIPENQLKEVFNPFVRGCNAKMISGSGLGLSIVAKAIKSLGGTLVLNSECGKGTEFKVRIPFDILSEAKAMIFGKRRLHESQSEIDR
jgi:signal transduction histidine kinase